MHESPCALSLWIEHARSMKEVHWREMFLDRWTIEITHVFLTEEDKVAEWRQTQHVYLTIQLTYLHMCENAIIMH